MIEILRMIIQPYGIIEFKFDKDKRAWKKFITYFKIKYQMVEND